MQLKVIKTDGSMEDYIHTKILKTICSCLPHDVDNDIMIAEQLTEAVTYYLYNDYNRNVITSNELLTIIQLVLTETGYDIAADNLTENYHTRLMQRRRTEVVNLDVNDLSDAQMLTKIKSLSMTDPWNKYRIVKWLTDKHNIDHNSARTIAAIVEEKVLRLNSSCIPTGVIKQIALTEAAMILNAAQELEPKKPQQKPKPAKKTLKTKKQQLIPA
jgi:hypothetical protein